MKKSTTSIIALIIAVIMLLTLTACGGGSSGNSSGTTSGTSGGETVKSSQASADGKVTRTIGTTNLGCFLVGSAVTANEPACTAIYDSLWIIDPKTKEIYSNVLEDWYYEDDLTIVATLKDGVYFSNGQKATSEDVLFSITNYSLRMAPIADMYGPLDVENSYCKDEFTCVFKFTEPWGPGIYTWASYLFCKSWCEEVGWDSTDWYNAPVGSGPYAVSEYVNDDHFVLTLRDDYWNKEAEYSVDEWVFKYYADASTMAIEFEQGKLDIVSGLNSTDFDRYLSDSSINVGVHTVAMNDVVFLTFGYENNDVFSDINVRKAICHAVDWESMGQMAYSSVQTVATSSLPTTSPYYIQTGTYEYNPELSKQILTDAGYSDGDIVINVTSMDSTMYKNVFEGFQYYLDQIGITLNLEFGDIASVMVAWMSPGGTDVGLQSNPTGSVAGEPHCCWMQMANTGAFVATHIVDDYFQEMNYKALHTVDVEERTEIYHTLQQYLYDNYMLMPICEYYTVYGYNPSVYTDEDMENSIVAGTLMYLWAVS